MGTGLSPRFPYSKPFLDISDQVQPLLQRQMVIDDRVLAADWLRRIGYYRFYGYAYPFRKSEIRHGPSAGRASLVVGEQVWW